MTLQTTRRALVAGAVGIAAGVMPAFALPALADSRLDPIFAAIERVKLFSREWEAIGRREPPTRHPDLPAWDAENAAAGDRWSAAVADMLQTRPTTAAGAAALCVYMVEQQSLRDGCMDETDSIAALELLAEALPRLT